MAPNGLQVGDLIDGYKIIRPLAKGGMGQIFLVEDTSAHRRSPPEVEKLALKTLRVSDDTTGENGDNEPRELRQLFEHEVEVLKALSDRSQRVVRLTDHNIHIDPPYFVMEYLPGWDLKQFLERQPGKFLDPPKAWEILKQICEGIAAAHGHQPSAIIHRDLKPSNIRVLPDESVKLLDFGLAKFWETTKGNGATAKGFRTACWGAPEHGYGTKPNPMIDIWGLGLLAFFVLTGVSYFDEPLYDSVFSSAEGRSRLPSAKERASKDLKCGPRIPPFFDSWFERCLGIRGDRYTSIEAAQRDLPDALFKTRRSRKYWIATGIGAAVLVVAIVDEGTALELLRSAKSHIVAEPTSSSVETATVTRSPPAPPMTNGASTGTAAPNVTTTTVTPTGTTSATTTPMSTAAVQPSAQLTTPKTSASKPPPKPPPPSSTSTGPIRRDNVNFPDD